MLVEAKAVASDELEFLQTKCRVLIKDVRICAVLESTGTVSILMWLWDIIPRFSLVIWGLIGVVVFLPAFVPLVARQLLDGKAPLATLKKWKTIYTVLTSVAGLRWGVGGALIYTFISPADQQDMLNTITTIGFASVVFNTVFAPAFYFFATALFLPFLIQLSLHGNPEQFSLFIMAVIAYLTVLLSGRYRMVLYDSNLQSIAALKRERDKADAATQAKSRFLSTASHDLRQPIHALALFVGILKKRTPFPDVAHLVNRIEMSVKVMEEMFNSLLDLSRLTSGTISVHWESLALFDMFKEIEMHFSPVAHAKGLTFRIRVGDETVKSDVHLLRQILHNLVSNAVRYTTAGGVLIAARRTAGRKAVRIEVWDTGCGIPADKLQEVFVEFVRLNQTKTNDARGLGIGLATAQHAAGLLGSSIKIRSVYGRGSCFTLEIPLTEEVMKISAITNAAVMSHRLENAFIFIIDDDEVILESMQLLLQKYGAFVLAAHSADEAMSLLAQQDRFPDLIISDCQLRATTTGLDLIKRIRQEVGDDIPAIIVTGSTLPSEDLRLDGVGFRVLQKPVDAEQFLATANEILAVELQ